MVTTKNAKYICPLRHRLDLCGAPNCIHGSSHNPEEAYGCFIDGACKSAKNACRRVGIPMVKNEKDNE